MEKTDKMGIFACFHKLVEPLACAALLLLSTSTTHSQERYYEVEYLGIIFDQPFSKIEDFYNRFNKYRDENGDEYVTTTRLSDTLTFDKFIGCIDFNIELKVKDFPGIPIALLNEYRGDSLTHRYGMLGIKYIYDFSTEMMGRNSFEFLKFLRPYMDPFNREARSYDYFEKVMKEKKKKNQCGLKDVGPSNEK